MAGDIVRVLRILEYVGPRDWVEMTLKNGGVPANGEFGGDHGWKIRSAILGQFPEILEKNNGSKESINNSED
jgi:hypothetical protein